MTENLKDPRLETFSPLSQRVVKDNPDFEQKLFRLKELMGEKPFEDYIENLISLKKEGSTLWLITNREMTRSILERNHLSQIRSAFDVEGVRIITQPW